MNLIARNTPVAFVVGVDGFLGLHLSRKLLEKDIQVVGAQGNKNATHESHSELLANEQFHTLKDVDDPGNIFPKLDYAFFVLPFDKVDKNYFAQLEKFLKICEQFKPRALFLSSVNLYDLGDKAANQLRIAENTYLEFVNKKHINSRVIRVSTIFGPGMDLSADDPLCRLLKAETDQWQGRNRKTAENSAAKYSSIDYSTRALFVADAVDLLIKAVMHGATAQQVYDGALKHPVKLNEIKQVLVDPLWYENSEFQPTLLPEWLTPNLIKTEKELLWKPRTKLVSALRLTFEYLVKNIPSDKKEDKKEVVIESVAEKLLPAPEISETGEQGINITSLNHHLRRPKFNRSLFVLFGGCGIIFYALIWPVIYVGNQVWGAKGNLDEAQILIKEGRLDEAVKKVGESQGMISSVLKQSNTWSILSEVGYFNRIIRTGTGWGQTAEEASLGISKTLVGTKSFISAWQVITNQKPGNHQEFLRAAREELQQGEMLLDSAYSKLLIQAGEAHYLSKVWGDSLTAQVGEFKEMAEFELKVTDLLLRIGELPGHQRLLLLVQDNTTLNSGGGKPVAAAAILFEKGLVKDIKVNPVSWNDLSLVNEPDFITNALGLKTLYQAETNNQAEMVVVMDVTALVKILPVITQNSEYQQMSQQTGLLSRLVAAGDDNQPAVSALQQLTDNLVQPLNPDVATLNKTLNLLLQEKHIMAYADDPYLITFLQTNNWAGKLSRPKIDNKGERSNLLALSETNMGVTHANYYLQRSFRLKSNFDKDGFISSRLTLFYRNMSPNQVWPGGSYINQLKVYLSLNSQVGRVYWGEEDITEKVKSFTDYGRAGYLMTLELKPGEEKNLILEYRDIRPVDFASSNLNYNLEIVKQPGTGNDNFEFILGLPEGIKLVGRQDKSGISREISFNKELNTDWSQSWVLQKTP